ncbi:1-deoxy-D-xylulose-5-phosphate synthase [Actinopolymorpha cephalotaxi]|uniref:1-deoxy-D-xylulose-5-phosphate synthase n=1 Tax=Actinopolymorpha cephalotaxi TaxID=504797 RepID=A0A1I2PSZ6_9ACTN|nr:1-deoxy-D-xylulose-5-phosphate synthase [Actinopolymorpha cephalotaxi]NYH83552.1 1-deoxy-D-xylulose-5-phosphate synthase [Actinopolymorpha cephalotaxi]SFG17127.1 1-deoxy-D-xylulose-5-phosphate synthase [Actinopolymorpha cephalotaxi]
MGVLEKVREPADLNALSEEQLTTLAREIRDFLVAKVSRTGGHLGPNLGIVELTLALHRVFESPRDRIIFDVGHQAYVHKMLTGRQEGFDLLRQKGGLSGYPSRAESEHDLVENSHASASLSYADGLAKAYQLRGEDRHVVAVIGDGALTGGMAWEALNNIAGAKDRPLVIVVNDNGRSYTPTVGGIADHLTALRTDPRYERVLDLVKRSLSRTPLVGPPLYDVLHGIKRGLKDVMAPQGLFEDLGMKYVGPVDGHDRELVEHALEQAKNFGGPVIVHCVTSKGHGYEIAEQDEADCFHSPSGAFDPLTGTPVAAPGAKWTNVFRDELVELGRERPDIVAITAAMRHPTGLDAFARAFPERSFDVGIAEQHAVTSAAGLAMGGMHPVVAIYSTFLNRAFDQMLMDVALHGCGATFVLDRAGVTGEDGPSHNGMWDMSILQVVPGLRLAAPRDGARLRELLREAVAVDDGPTVLRFPKGALADDLPALERRDGVDVLVREGDTDVLLVCVGSMAATGVEVAARLTGQGIGVTVVDPRWVKPVNPVLVDLARTHRLVVSLEDSGRVGGCGAALGLALSDARVGTPLHVAGIAQRFLDHDKRPQLLAEMGLGAQDLARDIVERMAQADDAALVTDDHGAVSRG